MQRTIRNALVYECRNMSDHDHAVKQQSSNYRFCHILHNRTRTLARKNQVKQPLRRGNQHQRGNEIGIHHVLKHVYRVQILFRNIVNWPVRCKPQKQNTTDKCNELLTTNHTSTYNNSWSNDSDRIDVTCHYGNNQHPYFNMLLKPPGLSIYGCEHMRFANQQQ